MILKKKEGNIIYIDSQIAAKVSQVASLTNSINAKKKEFAEMRSSTEDLQTRNQSLRDDQMAWETVRDTKRDEWLREEELKSSQMENQTAWEKSRKEEWSKEEKNWHDKLGKIKLGSEELESRSQNLETHFQQL
jgi:hypothetical protein